MSRRKEVTGDQIIAFEVTGDGPFPFDMLRYDRCWPVREAQDSYDGLAASLGEATRTVQLNGINNPTERRWSSFGWTVRLGVSS
jgi:hypothetical protein